MEETGESKSGDSGVDIGTESQLTSPEAEKSTGDSFAVLQAQIQMLTAKLDIVQRQSHKPMHMLQFSPLDYYENWDLHYLRGDNEKEHPVLDSNDPAQYIRKYMSGLEKDKVAPDEAFRLKEAIIMYRRELDLLEKEAAAVSKVADERDKLKKEVERLKLALAYGYDANASMAKSAKKNVANEDLDEKSAQSDLNPVGWYEFKGLYSAIEEESCAIEILVEEPIIEFDFSTSFNFFSDMKKVKRVVKNTSNPHQISAQFWKTDYGVNQLPERIRIKSRQLIKILGRILTRGESLERETGVPDSIIIMRPYRALSQYRRHIRLYLQHLESKFSGNPMKPLTRVGTGVEAHTASPETSHQATVAESKNDETLENDDELISEKFIEEAEDSETVSRTAYEHLKCLDEFLRFTVDKKKEYVATRDSGSLYFSDLWYLFTPGQAIIDRDNQIYRITAVSNISHKIVSPWKKDKKAEEASIYLGCVKIDCDGYQLGPTLHTFRILRYDGLKAVTGLHVLPLRFKVVSGRKGEAVLKDFVERGRRFLSVTTIKHMHYSGLTMETKDEVDSEVVVDFEEAFSQRRQEEAQDNSLVSWIPALKSLIGEAGSEEYDSWLDKTPSCKEDCCASEDVYQDDYIDKERSEKYLQTLLPTNQNSKITVAATPRALPSENEELEVTDDELLIMSKCAYGFVLRSRKWAKFDIDYLAPVGLHRRKKGDRGKPESTGADAEKSPKRPETAFDQLVLPKGHKEMVLSLIAQHFRNKVSASDQRDIVQGKGKGLILLLHGLPGVGKTTTAEGVAEMFSKPLFHVTCGDLGTTASDVEKALEKNFALASKWGCILLLDEADVFLASRTPQDFIRNGLVSVFLRVLEYYSGVLFLTTNRIGDFDEAFASRIHISLHYPELDLASTLKIFRLNISMIRGRFEEQGRKIEIDEDEIIEYATNYWNSNTKMRWNGRQIRNACQTALALAEFEAQGGSHTTVKNADATVKLGVEDLKTVSAAYQEFISYLKDIYGIDSDRRAKQLQIRARESEAKKHKSGSGVFSGGTNTASSTPYMQPQTTGNQQFFGLPQQQYQQAMASTLSPPASGGFQQMYSPVPQQMGIQIPQGFQSTNNAQQQFATPQQVFQNPQAQLQQQYIQQPQAQQQPLQQTLQQPLQQAPQQALQQNFQQPLQQQAQQHGGLYQDVTGTQIFASPAQMPVMQQPNAS